MTNLIQLLTEYSTLVDAIIILLKILNAEFNDYDRCKI